MSERRCLYCQQVFQPSKFQRGQAVCGDTEQINDLHRLYWSSAGPSAKLSAISNGLAHDQQIPGGSGAGDRRAAVVRANSDSFEGNIAEWVEKEPQVTAGRPLGYDGGSSILQEYVRKIRPQLAPRRAVVRVEPVAGERFEVDWGHFGDSGSVAIYDRVEEVVSYARSWRRGQTSGPDRFEKVLADERPAARRSQAQRQLIDSLDGMCLRATVEAYLRDMADTIVPCIVRSRNCSN